MALIVEDGSGLPNSNSYGTIAGARAYASDRAIVLSVDDTVVSSQLILGTDYLDSFADQYVGQPTSSTQALEWPRKYVMIDLDTPFPDDEIPPQLIEALYQCVIAESQGVVLQPNLAAGSTKFVIAEKVDVIETKYSEHIGTTNTPSLPAVDALLAGLLNRSGAFSLSSLRI